MTNRRPIGGRHRRGTALPLVMVTEVCGGNTTGVGGIGNLWVVTP